MKKCGRNPNFKTEFFSERFKVFNSAQSFVAEVEIFTHCDPAGVQTFHKNFFGKLPRSHTGQALIEIKENYALDSAGTNIEDLIAKIVDASEDFFAVRINFFGMRFKCDGARHQAAQVCCLNDFFQKSLMAAVNTIEITDCHRAVHTS